MSATRCRKALSTATSPGGRPTVNSVATVSTPTRRCDASNRPLAMCGGRPSEPSVSQASAPAAQRIYCIAGSKRSRETRWRANPNVAPASAATAAPESAAHSIALASRTSETGRSEPGFDAPEHSRHRDRDRVCHHVGIIARIQLAQGTTCRQSKSASD